MGHHKSTDETGRGAIGGRPDELLRILLCLKVDVEGLGEVLPQEVRGAWQAMWVADAGVGVGRGGARQIGQSGVECSCTRR